MKPGDRVYIAGHRGLVGSALVRALESREHSALITRTRAELDLTVQAEVDRFFAEHRPDYVFLAAALVGGLFENQRRPGDFIGQNLLIQTHVIDAARRHGVKKLMFLGSSCIYPRIADRLIREDDLLTAPLEPTNEAYAVAKIAGVKMCQFYRRQYGFDAISVMPPNLHGPNDDFGPESSHVLQGLLRRMTDAKRAGEPRFVLWGTGTPRREFLHVDDLADACVFLMERETPHDLYNVGTGQDVSVRELAELVKRVTGYAGDIVTDPSRADGTPRKTMDVSRVFSLGWRPKVAFEDAVRRTYAAFLEQGA
jgi:GDP-L-fucose synthase